MLSLASGDKKAADSEAAAAGGKTCDDGAAGYSLTCWICSGVISSAGMLAPSPGMICLKLTV